MNITKDKYPPPQLVEYIMELETKPFEPPNNNIYASELDGCIRKSWYRRKYQKPPSKKTAMYLRNGTWQHENFQQAYTTKEQRFTLPVKIGCTIVARADAINKDGELLEFKNVKNPYFINKKDEPNEWDKNRVLFYMWLGGYTVGHIYYFHAGPQEPNHYTITLDDNNENNIIMQQLEKRYKELALELHNGINHDAPPYPSNKRSFDCEFCDYQKECIKQNNRGLLVEQTIHGD